MTRSAPRAVALCLAVSPVVVLAAASPRPLKVYVTAAQVEARRDVDDATKNALKATRDEAREARKTVEKRLKTSWARSASPGRARRTTSCTPPRRRRPSRRPSTNTGRSTPRVSRTP